MKPFRIEDDWDDDCRLLRGGGAFLRRPNLLGNYDANCLVHEHRPQFGFRLVRDQTTKEVRR